MTPRNSAVFLAMLSFGLLPGWAQQAANGPAPVFVPPAIKIPNPGADAGSSGAASGSVSNNSAAANTTANGGSQSAGGDDSTSGQPVAASTPEIAPPLATPGYAPVQGPIKPAIVEETLSSASIYTIHLRPLFTTGVKFPDEVTGVAVGAPSLVDAEHNKNLPNLVFIKPETEAAFNSDVIVSLISGATVTLHVISAGAKGSNAPVDFMVDYSHKSSLLRGPAPDMSMFRAADGEVGRAGAFAGVVDPLGGSNIPAGLVPTPSTVVEKDPPASGPAFINAPGSLLEAMYEEQVKVGAPVFLSGTDYAHIYPVDKHATSELAVSLGRMVEDGNTMTLSFSVQNRSKHWVELMAPHLEFADPKKKPSKKHPRSISLQLPVDNYILSTEKLAPGERMDGAVEFERPSFKYRKQRLLLDVASAAEADMALYVPVPFTTRYGAKNTTYIATSREVR